MNLLSWLKRHPLKGPAGINRAQYTAEVMARVKELAQSASPARQSLSPGRATPAPARVWLPWPRLALTLATVAAGVSLVIGTTRYQTHQLAQQIARESQLLAALDEPELEPLTADQVEAVADELETMDALQLAASVPSDDQWVEQTLQLLDELDEDVPENAASSASEDEWLQELEQVDESDLAVTL